MHGEAVVVELPCEKVKQEVRPSKGLSKARVTFIPSTLVASLVPAEEVSPGEEGPVFATCQALLIMVGLNSWSQNPLAGFEKPRW